MPLERGEAQDAMSPLLKKLGDQLVDRDTFVK